MAQGGRLAEDVCLRTAHAGGYSYISTKESSYFARTRGTVIVPCRANCLYAEAKVVISRCRATIRDAGYIRTRCKMDPVNELYLYSSNLRTPTKRTPMGLGARRRDNTGTRWGWSGWDCSFPEPYNPEGWSASDRTAVVLRFQKRMVPRPDATEGIDPDSFLKTHWVFIWTCVYT